MESEPLLNFTVFDVEQPVIIITAYVCPISQLTKKSPGSSQICPRTRRTPFFERGGQENKFMS